MSIIKKLFSKPGPISLKTHNAYPEIMINDSQTKFTARLMTRNGTVVEAFEGECKNRKDGSTKASKLLHSVADKYLKKTEQGE